jgi:D-alanyl-D-alanine-carboxypeptidase/D-alanyl-D-alanine-endopeptidase
MKRQFSILLNLFLLLALSACGAARQPSRLPDPEEVKALLVQLVDVEKRVPGVAVGMIAADPQERWVVGYGRLSAADQRIPDGDTVFEIASVTKVFTGVLLAQAVVNGELKLDDPISMYLPEGVTAPEYEGRSITLLDLATHTSGLPDFPSNFHPKDPSNPFADYTMDQMYGFLSGYRLTRVPGSTYEYSNYGFGLLGNLLVRRAGVTDYEALLLERITRPLGMDSTRIQLTSEMRSRLATPHIDYSVETGNYDFTAFAGCGAIRSTANDMLTFLAANMGLTDTELQPALQMANTPQRLDMGLGWGLYYSGKWFHEHNGETGGYHSYLAWDPQRKIGVVVLTNASVSIDDVGLQLMGASDLLLSNRIFVLTAIAFMLLLAVLLAAQKKRRVKTTWVIGVLWLLLAVPFALVFYRYMAEGRGARILLPLSLVLLFMLVKALLDFVFRIDFRSNRMALLATLTLMCLALFSLIWIAFNIIPSGGGPPVLIAFGILVVSLIFTYRDRIRIRK